MSSALLLVGFSIWAQEIRTNAKGEKIVVFPDGSWVPLKEKGAAGTNMPKAAPEKWMAVMRDSTAQQQLKTFKDSLEMALSVRKLTEENYVRFSAKNPGDTTQKAIFEIQLSNQLAAIKHWGEVYKKAKLWAVFTPTLMNLPIDKQQKQVNNWEKEHGISFEKREEDVAQPAFIPITATSVKTSQPVSASNQKTKKMPCRLEFDGVDEFTGIARKDVAKALFFSYTPDHLRKFFSADDFLTCYGSISTSRGFFFLNIEIVIHAINAGNSYGLLERGSMLQIKLLDGEILRLLNNQTDLGLHQPGRVVSTYKAQYPLDGSIVEQLKTGEVDKVRIFWSSGYEDYEVYELDFFQNQFACLEGN